MPGPNGSAWPNSAACWSPAMPAIGMSAPPMARGCRTRRSTGTTCGSIARGTPNSASSSSSQSPVWMLNSSVREALDASVQCTRAAGELPDEPGVDGAEGEFAALGARPRAGHVVEQPGELGAGEIGVEHQPGLAREQRRVAAARSSSQIAAVRRSCQTMALAIGRPVARSQTTVVSRWLVMPMAAMSARARSGPGQRSRSDAGLRSPRSPARRARPSPAAGRSAGIPAAPTPRMLPSWSNTMARELVVPWSRARMYFMESLRLPRIVAAA